MKQLGKRSILKKTAQIGASTALSRLLGLVRELLFNEYLGVTPQAAAFIAAFRIPNFMRKIFAEGALSGVLVPEFIQISKQGSKELSSLMSQVLLFFQSFILLICGIVVLFPQTVLLAVAPGFTPEEIAIALPLVRILVFFILFISCSAVLGSALQAAHQFQVPAWGQVLLNIVFISALYVCNRYQLPVEYLCYAILLGALLHFLLHVATYLRYGFYFGPVSEETKRQFKPIMIKALPTLIVVGVMELNTWIDGMFASYMKDSITLIHYGSSFMRIPLGVFAVAFSTILLPHFARVRLYAPQRLSFYLFEGAKFIFFITLPATLVMGFFSKKIFSTLLLSDKFTMAHVVEAQHILIAFLLGLFFFSLNRIVLNIYYAYHDLMTPTLISLGVTGANVLLNWLLVGFLKAPGLALATSICGGLQSIFYIAFLQRFFNLKIYGREFVLFCARFLALLVPLSVIFYVLYRCGEHLVALLPSRAAYFFLESYGFWLWSLPLVGVIGCLLLLTRKRWGIKLYFLD